MSIQEIREFIKQELLKQHKNNVGLNGNKLRKGWLKEHHPRYLESIVACAPPCTKDASLSEKIYCLMNDIETKPVCYCCGGAVRYVNYTEGYRDSCGNKVCNLYVKANLRNESGLTPNERSAAGVSKAGKRLMSDGRTRAQHSADKAAATRKSTVLENGLTLAQSAAIKSAKTKMGTILPSGLTLAQDASRRSSKTMETRLTGSRGESVKEYRIRKATETKSTVGADGLDGFERAFANGAGRNCPMAYSGSLYYQGSYERDFLDKAALIGIFEQVQRGPRFKYSLGDGKRRQYRSDFLVNGKVFEMKSTWSYDEAGRNMKRRHKTNAKIKSAVDEGYPVVLVLNRSLYRLIDKNTLSDFDIRKDSLLDDEEAYRMFDQNALKKLTKGGQHG